MTSIHPKSEKAVIAHALHTGDGRENVHVTPSGAAHVVYDEPTCTSCGCTELNACPPGCYWVYLEEDTHRGLCSHCHTKGIHFTRVAMRKEELSMAAKKAKKAKKKKPASKKKETAAPVAS